MLVLLDNNYPGWRAVDAITNQPLPIVPVDLTFRGVLLSGTTQVVRMRYEPASFRLGLYLAALAVGVLAVFGVGGQRLVR